jgi:3-dehydroquinate synthase
MDIGSKKSFAMNKQDVSYLHPIWSSDPWAQLQKHIIEVKPDRIIVIYDTNTYRDCYGIFHEHVVLDSLSHVIIISAGEESKNIDTAKEIWEEFSKLGVNKKSLVINLGGGMICDIGAFCASTFHRGIPFINIPTSALAMVDAALGGKNGIDLGHLKNMVGTINFPVSVLIEPEFLKTLPELELQSGYAELLKQIIIADRNVWEEIRIHPSKIWKDISWWKANISAAIHIKMDIVSNDPFERGLRKQLNFGHTVGHGIESFFLSKERPIPHGLAVAAGMLIESYISANTGILEEEDLTDLEKVIYRDFGRLDFQVEDIEQIMLFMKSDKKNAFSKFSFSMIYAIGDIRENHLVEDRSLIRNAFEEYINSVFFDNE